MSPVSTCRFLSIVLYLMFLFIVVIVLLNVLIAQMSDTYTKVLSTAEGVHLFDQCVYIAHLENQKLGIDWCKRKLGCYCPCLASVSLSLHASLSQFGIPQVLCMYWYVYSCVQACLYVCVCVCLTVCVLVHSFVRQICIQLCLYMSVYVHD